MLHTVFFWLKPETTAEQRAFFEAELRLLPQIGYLASGFIGKPAPTPERPVTDHSFDYSLSLQFKTMEDHDFYQTDCKDHLRFVEACKPLFGKVIVYDSAAV